MTDEANQNTETPPTPPAAAAQQPTGSGTPSITPEVQAVIDARVRDAETRARNAAWADARRQFEARQKPAPSQAESTPQHQPAAPAAAPSSSLDIARVVMFTTEASKLGIPPKGVELLLSRLDAERPPDVASWVAQQASDYGWRPATSPATSTPAPATPSAATPAAASMSHPVTSNGAPSSPARMTDDVPLIDRSPSEQDAFRAQHGFVAFTDRVMREARDRRTRLKLSR